MKFLSRFDVSPLRWRGHPRKQRVIAVVVSIGIIVGGVIFFHAKNSSVSIATAKRENLVHTITAHGDIVATAEINVGFTQSKYVTSVNVYKGEKVKKGTILATLSSVDERTRLIAAQAALLKARAYYNKVLEGTSNEEIQLAQSQLSNVTRIQDGLVAQALQTLYTDDLVAIADAPTPLADTAPVVSGTFAGNQEGQYLLSIDSSDTTTVTYSGLEKGTLYRSASQKPLGKNGLSLSFPSTTYAPNDHWHIDIPNKDGAHYATNLAAYQTAVATRDSAIAKAKAELDLVRATARQPDIDTALADVVTAQAAVDAAHTALDATILRAPVEGVVTGIHLWVGALASVGQEGIDIEDTSNLYLAATIPTNDISTLSIGQSVTVVPDGASGETYHATVSSIMPSEGQGATTLLDALLVDTDGLKSGMTAAMAVQTAQVPNALVVPLEAVQTKNGKQIVSLVVDVRHHRTVSRIVTTGLVGDGGMVEIKSGLEEGDQVLWKPSLAR